MKKYTKIFALVLALAMMLITGCGKKTYATAGEWYDNNPMAATAINMAVEASDDGTQMSFDIVDNTIIYSMTMDEAIFGESEEMDTLYQTLFDESFDAESTTYTDIITEVSGLCGIASSELSVRIEIFNPGASEPGYTKIFTISE